MSFAARHAQLVIGAGDKKKADIGIVIDLSVVSNRRKIIRLNYRRNKRTIHFGRLSTVHHRRYKNISTRATNNIRGRVPIPTSNLLIETRRSKVLLCRTT